GGEVRRAEQDPAHLLEHDAELDEGEALAAVLLGDVEALEAELVRNLRPHRGVVALGGLHEPAHLGRGRLRLHELADGVAQLLLLFREGEVHRGSSLWSGRKLLSGHRAGPYRYRERAGRTGAGGTLRTWLAVPTSRTPGSASTS